MAAIELNPDELRALDEIAKADDWSREVLEKRVRHKLWDGLSFRAAVMRVLAEAERPDDDERSGKKVAEPTTKAGREELIRKVEEMRQEAANRFAAAQVAPKAEPRVFIPEWEKDAR